jgi:hypothetical protein
MTSFVEDGLREYHRRLPPGPRTGPSRSGRFANAGQLARRVPLDMYDGEPDGLDLVRWKPVPSTITDKALGECLCDRLVVTGESAGEVWIDNRASDYGLKPDHHREPRSFLAWYEGWLDHSLRQAPLAD